MKLKELTKVKKGGDGERVNKWNKEGMRESKIREREE